MNVGELKEAIAVVPDFFLVCFGRMEADEFFVQPDGLAIIDFTQEDNSIGFDDCMNCEEAEIDKEEAERRAGDLEDQVKALRTVIKTLCDDFSQLKDSIKDPAFHRHFEEADTALIYNRG